MSVSVSRSGSEKRKKTVVRTLRFTPDEDEMITQQAADAGLSVSAFIRNAALKRKMVSRTDEQFLAELLRLGRMQKHLFVEGKRIGDKEYSGVLVAITELATTLRKQLMDN
ncbi:nikA protein [Salmonella enterica subsp. enterica]|nr:nikA protein [Salmonella enterica subsp. enterica]MIF52507.1 nikA protein [Salmonella enterica subsp. enterica]